MPPEWVVIEEDGRLAIVEGRTARGVQLQLPLGGRSLVLPANATRPFDPGEYPVQISSVRRKGMKAAGQTPREVCNQCFTLKPVAEFEPNLHTQGRFNTRKDGSTIYRPTCRVCRVGVDGVRNHATRSDGSVPEKPPVGAFWCCPIGEKQGIVGVTVKLVLDHGHLTGDARDYVCDSCNTGLGRFRNGKDFLRNALAFLEKWEPEWRLAKENHSKDFPGVIKQSPVE